MELLTDLQNDRQNQNEQPGDASPLWRPEDGKGEPAPQRNADEAANGPERRGEHGDDAERVVMSRQTQFTAYGQAGGAGAAA